MDGSLVFDEWAEGTCSYKCQHCSQTFLGRARFSRHLDTDHDTDILAYLNKHGDALTCRMTVGCGLCGAQVLHDRSVLQDHLGTCHSGYDLFRYYKIYVNKRVVAKRRRKSQEEESGNMCASERKMARPIVLEQKEAIPKQVGGTFTAIVQNHSVVEHDSDIIVSACDNVSPAKVHPVPTYSNVFHIDYPCHDDEHSNQIKAQVEELNEELPQQTEEGFFDNRCEFTCSECPDDSQFQTDSYSKLEKHISRQHNTSSGVKRTRGKRLMHMSTKVVKYSCVICNREMLHDRRVIFQHALKIHGMQKLEYSSEVEARKIDGVSNNSDALVPPVAYIGKTVEPGKISDEHTTTTVANLCVFECDICHDIKYSWRAMRIHVKVLHRLKFITFMPKYIKEIRYHQCKLCRYNVVCDLSFLSVHLLSKHSMGLKDYSNLDRNNIKNNVRADTSLSKGKHSKIEKTTHLKVELKKKSSHGRDDKETLRATVPQVAFVGKTVDPGEISVDQTTMSIGNLCVFKCDICQEIRFSWVALRNHVKTLHSLESFPFLPKYIVETRYHKCKLCQSCIACDVSFLTAHLSSKHKMTLKDYSHLAENDDMKSNFECKKEAEWMPNIAGVESQAVGGNEEGVADAADKLISTACLPTSTGSDETNAWTKIITKYC